ncbi:MAG: hypothetical protein WCF10_14370 [Polyangiales bacterium]
MSAPIGRLKVRTSEGRNRRASATGRWKSVDPPMDVEGGEAGEARDEEGPPRFYPFSLRRSDAGDD